MAASKSIVEGSRTPTVDRRLVELLSGPEKVQALLRAGDHTHASFAEVVLARTGVGSSGDQVRHTIYAQRDTYPHVRTAIALEFEVPRKEIDLLLDGVAAGAVEMAS